MAQEQSRAQAQHKQVKNKHFWTFRAAAGDNAAPELILYGDIASETWWGDEVTPRQFTEELDALGAVPEIVVRINSGGGDVFAANAIYTRLKDNAAKITVNRRLGRVRGDDRCNGRRRDRDSGERRFHGA